MPVFSSGLRRLSTSFQAKLHSRSPQEDDDTPPLELPKSFANRRIAFEVPSPRRPQPNLALAGRASSRDGRASDDASSSIRSRRRSTTGSIPTPALTPDVTDVDLDSCFDFSPSRPPDSESDSPATAAPLLENLLSRLPTEIWIQVAMYLRPSVAAAFALANREMARRVGPAFWATLDRPEYKREKLSFLLQMEDKMPNHILCHECVVYHIRASPGKEKLRHDYRSKPIVRCPKLYLAPFTRLTLDRDLPYFLVKLAMERHRHGDAFGISLAALNRTWDPWISNYTTTSEWSHRTQFVITGGALLMKVTSTHNPQPSLTPSEQRLVLTCRKDYTANYSTCAHEARSSSPLFNICRCALAHIPPGAATAPRMPSQCAKCRPLWRCAICPSEYLVEVKLQESRRPSAGTSVSGRFHHALIVNRWTNLGDCSRPTSREWAASCCPFTYDEDESEIYSDDGDPRTIRKRFEIATGARESNVRAMPLRRPSHWESERWLKELQS